MSKFGDSAFAIKENANKINKAEQYFLIILV
jgi:hypothetical protein